MFGALDASGRLGSAPRPSPPSTPLGKGAPSVSHGSRGATADCKCRSSPQGCADRASGSGDSMDAIEDALQVLLGLWLDEKEINVWQMALRAIVVYGVTLLIVRLGKKRFMGRATAFDVILGIMLGSIASRAITGNAPLVPSLAATATLIALHSVLTAVACRWHGFGEIVKGRPRVIVQDGRKDEQ